MAGKRQRGGRHQAAEVHLSHTTLWMMLHAGLRCDQQGCMQPHAAVT